MPKRGLGRGLEAILGASTSGDELREIPVADVYPNPHQPRSALDQGRLEELAASIKEHGVVQPVLVRPIGDRFELVAGERRWRAAQLAGLATVPAMVRSMNERQSLEVALVENLQREDLNPIEQARAFRDLINLLGVTQDEAAQRVGLSRPAVANALRLLTLCDEVQRLVETGALSAGHARTLVGLDEEQQLQAAARIQSRSLTVREAEELARAVVVGGGQGKGRGSKARAVDPHVAAVEGRLREALGTQVHVTKRGTKGRLIIHFFSDEDLERILELLLAREERREAATPLA
jgi:ParB family chromosome partitioning protein